MALFSRAKGKRGERAIATKIRERFPQFASDIRRSIQSRAAEESDVTGLPGFWLEINFAVNPNPLDKLVQAEHDVSVSLTRKKDIPVAITHKTGARTSQATMRLSNLVMLSEGTVILLSTEPKLVGIPVTMDLEAFFDLVEVYLGRKK